MLEAILGIVGVLVLLGLGFYFTRGGGGIPGGADDPAREQLAKYTPLGDPLPAAGEPEHERETD